MVKGLEYELGLYHQVDIFNPYDENFGIAIQAKQNGEPYAVLTVNLPSALGDCEVIGIKNAAYVDTNNCPWVTELLDEGIAENTGFVKRCGFCEYPLYVFKEKWLREISGSSGNYEKYLVSYANCFENDDEEDEE